MEHTGLNSSFAKSRMTPSCLIFTRRTPLRWQDYRYIITQSPDPRGINVALLYQRDQFFYLRHESIPIRFSGNKHKLTRDILHVYGKIITGDTLDVFVCHFPSRYGGEKESEKDRFDAPALLRGSSDSLLLIREKAADTHYGRLQ